MDEYIAQLQKLGKNTDKAIGTGVYAMAGVVADAVRQSIESLSVGATKQENIAAYRAGKKSKLTKKEKDGLLDGLGISAAQNEGGYVNVKIGFSGYNSVKTKKYPGGQPNVLIARITESGSPYRDKTPFMRTAVARAREEALKKGQAAIDAEIAALQE